MSEHAGKVAIVFRADSDPPEATPAPSSRLAPIFAALTAAGLAPEPAVYSDPRAREVRHQLLAVDGVLVWVDPVAADGERTVLDGILRDVSAAGVWVGSHPDVIAKMATKEVLYTTRDFGWGTDTHRYRTVQEFRDQFPARLAADGIRVLKPQRGNAGIGVWKVALPAGQPSQRPGPDTPVRVQHALIRDETTEEVTLAELMARCEPAFAAHGGSGLLIDQAFARRIDQGIIRCYMVRDRLVGFCRQYPKGLSPEDRRAADTRRPAPSVETIMGLPSAKTMYGPDEPAFQHLRTRLERDWVPATQHRLNIDSAHLPVLWDADFLFGPPTPEGHDTYILCEINASSVMPFPPEALPSLARVTLQAVRATKSTREPPHPAP